MRKLQKTSAAHVVLLKIVDLGGKAVPYQLLGVLSVGYRKQSMFQEHVVDVLVSRGFVTQNFGVLMATSAGKEYAGQFYERPVGLGKKYVGKVAAPRVPPAFRPLSPRHRQAAYREGAFAHREIPSLIGSHRVLPGGEVME
jgi:hypothetical protein